MPRNPNWDVDELILALDLYIRSGRTQLSAQDPRVIALSKLLGRLPIHPIEEREAAFRNPTGVSMKLGNLLSIDPLYQGVGLQSGGQLDREVWDAFATEPYLLHQTAEAIKATYEQVSFDASSSYSIEGDDEIFPEGKILTRLHKQRERNLKAVRRKKEQVLSKIGRLLCEVCNFDFHKTYGALGAGFAECHHLVPISALGEQQRTRLADLAIVCSNCHRMLHRGRPLATIDDLRTIVQQHAAKHRSKRNHS